jgi:hypothetical protein
LLPLSSSPTLQKACHSERSEEPPHFAFVVAFAVALVLALAMFVRTLRQHGRARLQACPKSRGLRPYRSAEGWSVARRSKRLILLPLLLHLFFPYANSAQKSHVKPQTHLTYDKATTSEWHFSWPPTAILDIEIKKEKRGNHASGVTH